MLDFEEVYRELVYKDSKVFNDSDPGNAIYVVQSGSVGIFKLVEGEEVLLATLGKGEMFGEMAIIDGGARMASAVAMEDSVVAQIPSHLMDATLAKSGAFMRALLEILVSNLRQVHRKYMRRPRSIHDHLNAAAFHIRRSREFLESLENVEIEVESWRTLNRVEKAVLELRKAFEPFKDFRHNALTDAGLASSVIPPSDRS